MMTMIATWSSNLSNSTTISLLKNLLSLVKPLGFDHQFGVICSKLNRLNPTFCWEPSGKLTVCYRKWPLEIVDLPIKYGDFP
jgi:hypothetical protein